MVGLIDRGVINEMFLSDAGATVVLSFDSEQSDRQ